MSASDLPDRPNTTLLAKLDGQIRNGATALRLTHDEIDAWRAQFDIVITVHLLAYKHLPIFEIGDGV